MPVTPDRSVSQSVSTVGSHPTVGLTHKEQRQNASLPIALVETALGVSSLDSERQTAAASHVDLQRVDFVATEIPVTRLPPDDQHALRQSLTSWARVAHEPALFPYAFFALPSGVQVTCRHDAGKNGAEPRLEVRTWEPNSVKHPLGQHAGKNAGLTEDRRVVGSAALALDIAMQNATTVVLLAECEALEWLITLQHLLPVGARRQFYFSGWEIDPPGSPLHLLILLSEDRMAACHVGNSYLDLRDSPSEMLTPSTLWGRRLQLANRNGGWSAIIDLLHHIPASTTLDMLRDSGAEWAVSRTTACSTPTCNEISHSGGGLSPWSLSVGKAPLLPKATQDFELDLEGEQRLERLDELDAAAFAAIAGDDAALRQFVLLWPEVQRDLDDSWLEESRQQYVKRCLETWQDQLDAHGHVRGEIAQPGLQLLRILLSRR